MYTRKHDKRTVQSKGETLDGMIPFPLMTKGGEIYQMQRIEAWFQGSRFIRYRVQRQIYHIHMIEAWFHGENE